VAIAITNYYIKRIFLKSNYLDFPPKIAIEIVIPPLEHFLSLQLFIKSSFNSIKRLFQGLKSLFSLKYKLMQAYLCLKGKIKFIAPLASS